MSFIFSEINMYYLYPFFPFSFRNCKNHFQLYKIKMRAFPSVRYRFIMESRHTHQTILYYSHPFLFKLKNIYFLLLLFFSWMNHSLSLYSSKSGRNGAPWTSDPSGPVTSTALVFPLSSTIVVNSTFSPSANDRKPSAMIPDWWTKTSPVPSSGTMKP